MIKHSQNIPEVCPLTQSQLGIYLECIDDPKSVKYNIGILCRLPEGVDIPRFIRAIKKVAAKHKVLNVSIGTPGGVPSMIYREREFSVEETEAEDLDAECRRFCRPFDLEAGPLCRFEIAHTNEGTAFIFDIHHLVFDGTSLKVFVSQIASVYEGGECPEETLTYFDAAQNEAEPKDPLKVQQFRDLFKEKLDGIDCDSKPVRDNLTEPAVPECITITSSLADKFTAEEVADFVKSNNISENALFLGSFGYALAKFNGTTESFFTTAYTGRTDPGLSTTVGMFVRTLPISCSFNERMKPVELLATAYEDYYRIKKNDCVTFGELASQYGINMDISFIYQSALFADATIHEGKITVDLIETGDPVADLELMVKKRADGYSMLFRYMNSEYSESFARSFINFYGNVVRGMMTAETLGDIPLCDASDEATIAGFNKTEKPYDTEKTVVDLFRSQVSKTPDACCLVFEDKHFTYRQIDEITDRLAKALLSMGIGKGSVSGVLIPRCEYMLICSLGILKAGGAYMPLDPSYPPERINLMMRDSGAALLITTPELSGIITDEFSGKRMMCSEIPEMKDSDVPLPVPEKDDLFVLLYTSGSTGMPKGVRFAHSNTMVTSAWERDFYGLGVGCNVTAYASYGFDANVFDTYATITSGAALHIISDDIRLDLSALQKYFNDNNITHSTMTTQVGRQFALMGGSKTLRCLNVAGEKLTPLTPPGGFDLYNLYGPTEGSILVSGFKVDKFYRDIPIGKAIDNVKLYVTDPCGRLLPTGAVGELWISGAHVTQGYLNRPDKTAEAYGENHFCKDKGYDKIYRTGDIVRFLGDGNLQFVGRRDGQIKVRGFRVELTEVEEVIRRFDGILDATVAAFDDPAGGKFIAAYVVSDKEIDIPAMNDFIRSEKPPYMVPAVTMQIDKIPLNQNQKVNKKALPFPERKAENIVPPENDTQQKIFDIIADVIGHKAFGVETNIFDAGLTSIGTLKLNVMLGDEFGVALKIDDLKQNDTVRKLESLISSAEKKAEVYEKLSDYPITQTQKGIFIECCMHPDTVTYNIPLLLKLGKGIDTKKLASAVMAAINAHPYMKTTLFAAPDGDIRARRNDGEKASVAYVKCEKLPPHEELVRPYQLLDSPLYRAAVYKASDASYLFLDCHHIISDGTSEAILLSDIEKAYNGETLKAEAYSGFEAAADEEKARKSERYTKAKAYYDSVFSGCAEDCMPSKAPDRDCECAGSLAKICDVNAEAVIKYCNERKLTPNAFFNSAFGFTLSRFVPFDDVIFTTVYNGRSDSRLSSSVTMLVKTLPVLVKTEGEKKVADLIRETQEQLFNSMANDVFSFAEVSHEYGIKSNIIFVYQGDDFEFDSLCGEDAKYINVLPSVAKAPISLNVYLRGDSFELNAEYRRDIYNSVLIESLLDSFSQVIGEFLVKESTKDVSLLSVAAKKRLAEINDTHRDFENIPVKLMFERHAASHPDRVALIGSGKQLSYDELNRRANRIAHSLINLGVKTDDIIGMVLDRTVELSISEIAILKAGGAFLGILPNYPDDRIEYCLTDAGSPIVITTEEIKASKADFFTDDKPFRTMTVEELMKNSDESDPDIVIPPDSLCYCIYTSGSTGKPKGVMIEQHNLVCFAQPFDFTYSYFHGDKSGKIALALSSISFDVSIFDNLVMLLNGKTVCIATDYEIHNPAVLSDLIVKNRIDTVIATPSMLTNYIGIEEFRSALKGVYTIVGGAETFPAKLFVELKKISPGMHIINGYGPTECTISCCSKKLNSENGITIGGPSANTLFYVVDRFGNILPPYAAGELIICGELVGRGYVNLPEKTKASFFTLNGIPAYHSGDTVRFNKDGEIEFFGRMDNQIKLRGFRIELDEIEKVICSYKGIRQSKVVVRNNGSEDYLAGYFTADNKIDIPALSEHMKSKLTYYMVPDVIAQLDAMPLTPNGKIDKKALPEIKKERRQTGRRAPKKSTEEELCELFRSVLSLDEFYADDNFFEMGGTSLSASKVTMQLMSAGVKVEYQDIFDHPTPESLAEFIDAAKAVHKDAAGEEKAKDESDISELLKYNTLGYAAEVTREPLGDVLLTGAVGFLGIHVLIELVKAREGRIICLVRKGDSPTSVIRLKNMLMYYFGRTFEEEFESNITVVDADITDGDLTSTLAGFNFDTLINCAACVKHYAADDIIEKINVHGVENLIRLANEKHARMIQISTTSVPGVHTDETYKRQVKMHENELFVIDSMDNKYCISKYHAELKMLDAIKNGMRGKIIRVGNLMGRHSDGEFQINFNTNAFLHALRGFATIGKCPISHSTDPMSFSPIDLTARAIILLAGTNDKFTVFHANNRFGFDEMQLIEACNRCGISIVPVDDKEYYSDYYRLLGNDKINSRLSGLVTNDRPDLHMVDTDNIFTANVLYRLGFSWPLIDTPYLERAIDSLMTLDYFELDEVQDY